MSRLTPADRPPAVRTARPTLSRRAVLGAAAAGAAGLLAGRIGGPLLTAPAPDPSTTADSAGLSPARYPFFGPHQAGMTTPAQGHLHFAAFDLLDGTDRRDLVRLLRDWSSAAGRMTDGLSLDASPVLGRDPEVPPIDTGEALDLTPSRLTITIGLGPALFELDGVDRYGIAEKRPTELERLPSFAGDALEAARSDGDLCVQVCSDDPLVGLHAIRNLARIAVDRARIRWSQTGFVTVPTAGPGPGTPRNLMGFRDGTHNIPVDDRDAVDRHVWLPPASTPAWLAGGTYLVIRTIRILIEDWDLEPLSAQEATFGRSKATGAPLSGGEEMTSPDFAAVIDGADAIARTSHVRLAHPSNNGGIRILRRGYNYVDGTTSDGHLDAGLVFISFQRSPRQFIALQRALATDKLNEYVRHVGSAAFAVPPGATEGGFVGETLLD